MACQEVVYNGGFEQPNTSGGAALWTEYSKLNYALISTFYAHPPSRQGAWLGGDNGALDWISQPLTLPKDVDSLTLTFWWALASSENPGAQADFLKAQLVKPDGVSVITTLVTINNDSAVHWTWNLGSADLLPYGGQPVQLRFVATTDSLLETHFFVDDVSIQACSSEAATMTPTGTLTASVTPSVTPSASATTTGVSTPTGTSVPTATLTATPTWAAQSRIRLPLILR